MISNPVHGWCSFVLSNNKNKLFIGTPSYLTNVPIDLLEAFLDYKQKGQGMAWFDEEGSEFTLVLTPYSMFIITEDKEGRAKLYDFSEIEIDALIRELIDDVEANIDAWASFECSYECDDTFQENKDKIVNLIEALKKS